MLDAERRAGSRASPALPAVAKISAPARAARSAPRPGRRRRPRRGSARARRAQPAEVVQRVVGGAGRRRDVAACLGKRQVRRACARRVAPTSSRTSRSTGASRRSPRRPARSRSTPGPTATTVPAHSQPTDSRRRSPGASGRSRSARRGSSGPPRAPDLDLAGPGRAAWRGRAARGCRGCRPSAISRTKACASGATRRRASAPRPGAGRASRATKRSLPTQRHLVLVASAEELLDEGVEVRRRPRRPRSTRVQRSSGCSVPPRGRGPRAAPGPRRAARASHRPAALPRVTSHRRGVVGDVSAGERLDEAERESGIREPAPPRSRPR